MKFCYIYYIYLFDEVLKHLFVLPIYTLEAGLSFWLIIMTFSNNENKIVFCQLLKTIYMLVDNMTEVTFWT